MDRWYCGQFSAWDVAVVAELAGGGVEARHAAGGVAGQPDASAIVLGHAHGHVGHGLADERELAAGRGRTRRSDCRSGCSSGCGSRAARRTGSRRRWGKAWAPRAWRRSGGRSSGGRSRRGGRRARPGRCCGLRRQRWQRRRGRCSWAWRRRGRRNPRPGHGCAVRSCMGLSDSGRGACHCRPREKPIDDRIGDFDDRSVPGAPRDGDQGGDIFPLLKIAAPHRAVAPGDVAVVEDDARAAHPDGGRPSTHAGVKGAERSSNGPRTPPARAIRRCLRTGLSVSSFTIRWRSEPLPRNVASITLKRGRRTARWA